MATGTPLYERTNDLCHSKSWRQWSGYFAASSYGDFVQPEYAAIRHSAALFDVSPLYKYVVEGPDASALMDRVFTQDIGSLPPGRAVYTPWCDERGKLRQEGTVFKLGHNEYQVNAAEPALRWLSLNAPGYDVTLSDRSIETAAVALQGPRSAEILAACGAEMSGLPFFGLRRTRLGSVDVLVSRTGYTGDLGFEVWMDSTRAVEVWDTLMSTGQPFQITPSGLLALDMARLEAGFILIGVDYHSAEHALVEEDFVSPYEVGLGWAVKLNKPDFIGKRALSEEKLAEPKRKLVGLEIGWEPLEQLYLNADQMPDLPLEACRESVPVYAAAGPQIGRVSTRMWSTLLKKYIALATVDARNARPGTHVDMEVTVQYERKRAPATIVRPQFFRPKRMRKTI